MTYNDVMTVYYKSKFIYNIEFDRVLIYPLLYNVN